MMRKGAALWRLCALAGWSLAGLAATAEAQQWGAPRPLAETAAQPIRFAPAPGVVAPAGYYDHFDAASETATEVATETVVNGIASADAAVAGHGCGGCDTCAPCRPCYAGPRCLDPWYLSFSGGWAHRDTVHEANDPQTFIDFEEGFAVNGALGYRFNMFRVEAEYSFLNHEVERAGAGPATRAGIPPSAATGNVNLRALMFNVYHDIELPFTAWRPYLGAGIGLYQSEINSLYPDFFGDPNLAPFGFNTNPVNTTSDTPFAYQFRAGASLPLGPRTEFFTGYRYFKGEELTFAAAPFASPAAPTFHPDGAEVHAVEFGLRVRF